MGTPSQPQTCGGRLTALSQRLALSQRGAGSSSARKNRFSTQTSQRPGRSGPRQATTGPHHFSRRLGVLCAPSKDDPAPEKIVTPIAAPRSPRKARRSLDPARSAPAANFVFRKRGDEDDHDVHRLWIALRSRFGGAGKRAQALVRVVPAQTRHQCACDSAHS
jgi:hypothetical protein